MIKIRLAELKAGIPNITKTVTRFMAEAAAVCLQENHHISGQIFNLDGDYNDTFKLIWRRVSDSVSLSHYDPIRAVEEGAYGISFLIIRKLTDYAVLRKSRIGEGVDWWLGYENSGFQNSARLEVSGINKGKQSDINSRVMKKIEQSKRSDGLIPVYIIVVEFGSPKAQIIVRT